MKRAFCFLIVAVMLLNPAAVVFAVPLAQIYQIVERHAVEPVDSTILRQQELGGIGSYINDPYFLYLNPDVFKHYLDNYQGYYGGIGAQIYHHEGKLVVWSVHANTPASAAGLRFLDEITGVDGRDVLGLSSQELTLLLRGLPGTKVTVTFLRDGKAFTVTMTRAIIQIPTVRGYMQDGVAVIELNNFNAQSPHDFRVVLTQLRLQYPHGLVVDVRGNPGGALSSVAEIAQELVPKGPVVRIKNQQGNETILLSEKIPAPLPFLVILTDENTASAAEILAGAVQDRGTGLVIGGRSYGKGTVQSIFRLVDNGGLRLTTARFFTPLGKPIDRVGIQPDIEIYDRAAQLNFAVGFIKNNAAQQMTLTIGQSRVWLRKSIVLADSPPFIHNNRSFIPLRLLAESMGYIVDWDPVRFTATLRRGERELRVPLLENAMYLNATKIPLETSVQIRSDRAFLPARAVAEALGAQVFWDNDARQVTIRWQ